MRAITSPNYIILILPFDVNAVVQSNKKQNMFRKQSVQKSNTFRKLIELWGTEGIHPGCLVMFLTLWDQSYFIFCSPKPSNIVFNKCMESLKADFTLEPAVWSSVDLKLSLVSYVSYFPPLDSLEHEWLLLLGCLQLAATPTLPCLDPPLTLFLNHSEHPTGCLVLCPQQMIL